MVIESLQMRRTMFAARTLRNS